MTQTGGKVALPVLQAIRPGRTYTWLRRATQWIMLIALLLAPLLGGWQRLERNYLSAWDGHGWDLPAPLVDRLPAGQTAASVYDLIMLKGGGVALDVFGIPFMDPSAGLMAAPAMRWSATVLLALAAPLVVGLIGGRVFCGWLCPYGSIARATRALLARLPWTIPAFAIPKRRWLRFLLLLLSLSLGLAGSFNLLYLLLPHLLLQQSAYGLWLMGGGGVVLGWLLGLFIAGLLLGPTTYCATLCPTGGLLSVLGRAKLICVTLQEPAQCGSHCHLCSSACWLSLDPASGDPGPDCDACARCFGVCPQVNLRVGVRKPKWLLPMITWIGFSLAGDANAQSYRDEVKPRLLLSQEQRAGDVRGLLSVVGLSGVELAPDEGRPLSAARVSLVLMRGKRGTADTMGRLDPRETYAGPLVLRIERAGKTFFTEEFSQATAPRSTPRRAVYTLELADDLGAGARIVVEPIRGWLTAPMTWSLSKPPDHGMLWGLLTGSLGFFGLLSLALTLRRYEAPQ